MSNNHGTIHSLAVRLTPTRPATVRATLGHQAHAAFLQTVREADPALAEVLHAPQLPTRPFTVSPLLGVGQAQDGLVTVQPDEDYFLRFTVLYQPIFEQFMARFLTGKGRPVVRLGRALFVVREILATPESSPWAGYTSFGQLARQAQPQDEIDLDFGSPTVFSFGRQAWGLKMVPLPEPDLVFRSLWKRWNTFTFPELFLDEDLLAYVAENVVVKQYHIETRMQHFGRSPQVGFLGQVTYKLMGRGEQADRFRCQLNLLADFAFYSGVGYKTAQGMGQCRRVVG
ncbi:MAG: CRISPR system precrRNA processing endoribonuclease RAMP protein Cas6 [Chloroflexota bacterium]